MNRKLAIALVSLSVLFVFTIICEDVEKRYDITYRPSFFLSKISKFLTDTFEYIGEIFAKLSSFYTYINIDSLKKTLEDLIKPIFTSMMSPFYIVKGYALEIDLYEHPYIVFLGSVTLVALVLALLYKFKVHKKLAKLKPYFKNKFESMKTKFMKYNSIDEGNDDEQKID